MVVSENTQGRLRNLHVRCDGCDTQRTFTFRMDKPMLHALREGQWFTEGSKHFCDSCVSHVRD